MVQKERSCRCLFQCQSDQREGVFDKKIQMNFKHNTLFHSKKLLTPKPPSVFGKQTVVQAIFANPRFSMFPDHRNREHNVSIYFMKPFDSMKAETQKFTVPNITVFSNCSLPAKDMSLTDHDWKLRVILLINDAYSPILSFRLISGSPRYRMGRALEVNPYLEIAVDSP